MNLQLDDLADVFERETLNLPSLLVKAKLVIILAPDTKFTGRCLARPLQRFDKSFLPVFICCCNFFFSS
jgi:hypothetical protein